MAGAAGSELSRGGMQTKIEAAKITTGSGTHMVIASGACRASARRHRQGRAVYMVPHRGQSGDGAQEMDRRLARTKGTLIIDAGAVAALRRGNSLLPVGVVRIEGNFARGDAVIIRGPDGAEIGRGYAPMTSRMRKKSGAAHPAISMAILGFSRASRDDPSRRSGGQPGIGAPPRAGTPPQKTRLRRKEEPRPLMRPGFNAG